MWSPAQEPSVTNAKIADTPENRFELSMLGDCKQLPVNNHIAGNIRRETVILTDIIDLFNDLTISQEGMDSNITYREEVSTRSLQLELPQNQSFSPTPDKSSTDNREEILSLLSIDSVDSIDNLSHTVELPDNLHDLIAEYDVMVSNTDFQTIVPVVLPVTVTMPITAAHSIASMERNGLKNTTTMTNNTLLKRLQSLNDKSRAKTLAQCCTPPAGATAAIQRILPAPVDVQRLFDKVEQARKIVFNVQRELLRKDLKKFYAVIQHLQVLKAKSSNLSKYLMPLSEESFGKAAQEFTIHQVPYDILKRAWDYAPNGLASEEEMNLWEEEYVQNALQMIDERGLQIVYEKSYGTLSTFRDDNWDQLWVNNMTNTVQKKNEKNDLLLKIAQRLSFYRMLRMMSNEIEVEFYCSEEIKLNVVFHLKEDSIVTSCSQSLIDLTAAEEDASDEKAFVQLYVRKLFGENILQSLGYASTSTLTIKDLPVILQQISGHILTIRHHARKWLGEVSKVITTNA